jgi:hypothetical protein
MHESFLIFGRFRFLRAALLMVLACVVAYAVYSPIGGHNGGTWLGYVLGTLGALLIVWLMWLGIRKRHYGKGGLSVQGWLSAHVYLGLGLIVVATLHTGFQFGWNLHTLAYTLMMIVIVSGVFGVYAYVRLPGLMTENRRGQTLQALLTDIVDLDRQCREAAMPLGDEFVREVQLAQERTHIGGSMRRQLSGRDPNCGTTTALMRVRALAAQAPAERQAAINALLVALGKKQELVGRARQDVRMKAMMDIWLYVHVPLSIALLASLAAHIIAVFFYW